MPAVELEMVAFEPRAMALFHVLLALMFCKAPAPAPVPFRIRVPALVVVMLPWIWRTAPFATVVLAVLAAVPRAPAFWMVTVPELMVVAPV